MRPQCPAYFSRSIPQQPLFRLMLVLFAFLQVAAPLWHVCELRGACLDHKQQSAIKALKPWKPECGGGRFCACKPPAGTTYSPTGYFLDGRPGAFKGTCLARELMSMGRVHIAPLSLDFEVIRVRAPRSCDVAGRDIPAYPRLSGRGPPLLL